MQTCLLRPLIARFNVIFGPPSAALFGSRIPDCARVTILYTGNMSKRKTLETLWLKSDYVDAM